jgi:hypothetical protein
VSLVAECFVLSRRLNMAVAKKKTSTAKKKTGAAKKTARKKK